MEDDKLKAEKIKALAEQLEQHSIGIAPADIPKKSAQAQWMGAAGIGLAISTLFCASAVVVGFGVACGVRCYQVVLDVLGG